MSDGRPPRPTPPAPPKLQPLPVPPPWRNLASPNTKSFGTAG